MINATGVWTDEIQQMIGGKGQFRVQASKGVHIVVAAVGSTRTPG